MVVAKSVGDWAEKEGFQFKPQCRQHLGLVLVFERCQSTAKVSLKKGLVMS